MAIKDVFKKRKKEKKRNEEFENKSLELNKENKENKKEKTPKKKKDIISVDVYKILKSFHITEKATELSKENQYLFKVFPTANKTKIKTAVESLYNVKVLGVKIIKVPGKKRRLGKIKGCKKGYKKAIVRIREGEKIEVLSK